MNILIIGNSHAAALCQALVDGWCIKDVTFKYYIIPGRDAPSLIQKNGLFFPRGGTTNLRTNLETEKKGGLDLHLFDVIVLSAVGLMAARKSYIESNEHILGKVRCLDWQCQGVPISISYMKDIIKEHIYNSALFQFCLQIPDNFRGKIFIQPTPFPAESVVYDPQWFPSIYWRQFADLTYSASIDVFSDIGILIPHPQESFVEFGVTKNIYARDNDGWHMSQNYGHLVLNELKKLL